MKKRTFTHVVRYIEFDDGDIYVIPDELSVKMIQRQIDDAMESLGTECNVETKQALEHSISLYRQSIEQIESITNEYAQDIKEYRFEMHRYSWNEKEQIKEDARIYNQDGSVGVNAIAHTLSLVTSCIDSWSEPEAITEVEVGALPPAVFESVYRKLIDKSEPSAARLAFRRAGSA